MEGPPGAAGPVRIFRTDRRASIGQGLAGRVLVRYRPRFLPDDPAGVQPGDPTPEDRGEGILPLPSTTAGWTHPGRRGWGDLAPRNRGAGRTPAVGRIHRGGWAAVC